MQPWVVVLFAKITCIVPVAGGLLCSRESICAVPGRDGGLLKLL